MSRFGLISLIMLLCCAGASHQLTAQAEVSPISELSQGSIILPNETESCDGNKLAQGGQQNGLTRKPATSCATGPKGSPFARPISPVAMRAGQPGFVEMPDRSAASGSCILSNPGFESQQTANEPKKGTAFRAEAPLNWGQPANP